MSRRNQDQVPMTAAEAFDLWTVDRLKTLAKFVTHNVPARKAELVKLLTKVLQDENNLREFYEEQDELGQAALQEATHDPQGELDLFRFEAKYGDVPRFQMLKEGTQEYYSEWNSRPTKLRLFFPQENRLATDVREKMLNFVPPPKPATVTAVKELPEKVKPVYLRQDGYWARQELEEETPYIRATARAAQLEVKTVLRLVENSQLKVGEKTQKPSSPATLKAIEKVLTDGDYYSAEDAEKDYDHDPSSDLLMKPFAWPLLIQAAGWASVSGGKLQLTESGRKALHKPAPELLRHAWEKWQKATLHDELSRVNLLKGQQGKGGKVLTALAPRRKVIAQALQTCPAGVWIATDEFFRQVKLAPAPGLTVCHDLWGLYIDSPQYGSLAQGGYFVWECVEGRYIMALLFEYAATLGLVDIAYISPSGARNEYHELWGTDDYSCLSRYDGLLYLRINPLGAWILGQAPEYVPEQVEEEKLLKVLPNRDIVAEHTLPVGDALFLDRFAERQSPVVWHLDKEKILTAVTQGRTVQELTEYLRAKSSVGFPETVEVFLQDLQHRAALLHDRGTARLIECADHHTATLLANDRKLKGMVKLAGETWLVFATENEAAVRRALKDLGYVLPPMQ